MEHPSVQAFMAEAERRNPHEAEFIQAVEEVAETIIPFIEANPRYQGHALLERMIEPERVIQFRVPWTDDDGHIQVNRGTGWSSTLPSVPIRAAFVSTRASI